MGWAMLSSALLLHSYASAFPVAVATPIDEGHLFENGHWVQLAGPKADARTIASNMDCLVRSVTLNVIGDFSAFHCVNVGRAHHHSTGLTTSDEHHVAGLNADLEQTNTRHFV